MQTEMKEKSASYYYIIYYFLLVMCFVMDWHCCQPKSTSTIVIYVSSSMH